jgi:hypothetical protein
MVVMDLDVDYLTVFVAAVAQFIIGAIWYMPIFGKVWGEIHGFSKLSKKEQQQAQKEMMPMLAVQFAVTIVTTVVLAKLILLLPDYSAYSLAGLAWLGFVVPVQASAVIFGGTAPKWVLKKIMIMAGGSLACLLAAAAILNMA